jgi:hypothetical protein
VQVKSEAHDKELYQQFKQDIDNEVADMFCHLLFLAIKTQPLLFPVFIP